MILWEVLTGRNLQNLSTQTLGIGPTLRQIRLQMGIGDESISHRGHTREFVQAAGGEEMKVIRDTRTVLEGNLEPGFKERIHFCCAPHPIRLQNMLWQGSGKE